MYRKSKPYVGKHLSLNDRLIHLIGLPLFSSAGTAIHDAQAQ